MARTMEAEKGTPKLRRTRSEVSPNTVLPRFAEVISEASPNSLRRFAEVTSEASPMLRRTQLRYFAEVTSEASPKHTLQRHISSCTSAVAHYRISTYVTTRLAKLLEVSAISLLKYFQQSSTLPKLIVVYIAI